METKIINGSEIAKKITENLKKQVENLDVKPGLAVIIIGNDEASRIYVKNKVKTAREIGFYSVLKELPSDCTKEMLFSVIEELNNDKNINGILLQLPLPKHLKKEDFLDKILPYKDVDGFNSYNTGKLARGEKGYAIPCTPKGIMKLLENIEIEGKNAVILGRSNIVGKPAALMLLNRNATVTIAHSKTKDLEKITQNADILICAIGKKEFVKKEMIKQGAIIIDVGINRKSDGKLTGDVDFNDVMEKVSLITPVPKGVGPMTIACLMENTYELYLAQKRGIL
ncbi:MAG: bifunctional 5,10-methylenetetrahydrofolate dehydrogenase/5,10-methenyltetrahydrofolate cyclohydrolase [Candidatus Gastranaerophilales bacterium]|nr:bifunctional 5,10-methylenetetrahydrofolate dehydrogenase/5,10-methenyltetrahydrofolate cyclohydrolase [Candidatus Gastranaerophilales bacterium]